MNRRLKQAMIGTGIVCIIILFIIGFGLVQKFTPSKEKMELTEYYPLNQDEVLILMQDQIYERFGLIENQTIYMDYETVYEYFNKRMYWDANENIFIYTTPTQILKIEVDSEVYDVNGQAEQKSYTIVKEKAGTIYIALDFVQEYSDMKYEFYSNPNRIVIDYQWGDYLVANVKKPTQLRVEPDIKSDILLELTEEEKLVFIDTNEVVQGGFIKVMTKDGVIGYVKSKHMNDSYYEELKSDFEEPIYSNIKKDEKINLVWHQVTNMDANNGVLSLLGKTKGVTTVSPTWFKVTSNEGTISSLASQSYVQKVHDLGMEVWGLVDDFSSDINMYEILSYTSRRENLINALISQALLYQLDGINLDFEKIPYDAGIHYTQFIRELSVQCRNNGIVLSIDNYVPSNFTVYYDKEEQGIVADYVVVMSYDEHYAGSTVSGSVASIGFLQKAINDILTMVPKDKVIMGIPFYSRQWKEVVGDNGEISVSSTPYSMSNAAALLSNRGIEPVWEEESGQYYGEYELEDGIYKIWLEEDTSIEQKMILIKEADVAGIGCWKLGLEKESVWEVITSYLN